MSKLLVSQNGVKLAGFGFVLIIPSLLLVTGGILQSVFGASHFNDAIDFLSFLFNPAIILGGLMLAFGLNLIPVMRIYFREGKLVGMVKVQGRLLNLGLITAITLLTAVIFLYLLAENFQVFAR